MEKSTERLCLRCEKGIPRWKAKSEKFCGGVCRLKFREEQRKLKALERALSAKSEGKITIHSCLASPLDPRVSDCRCRQMVTEEQAKILIGRGDAVDFASRDSMFAGGPILLIGKLKRTPRVATLEKSHLERANVQYNTKHLNGKSIAELQRIADADKAERAAEERVRIEIYGLMTLLARVKVGKQFVRLKREPMGGRENDWGRSIITHFSDERTCPGADALPTRDSELQGETTKPEETLPDSKSDSEFVEADIETVSLDAISQVESDEALGCEDEVERTQCLRL